MNLPPEDRRDHRHASHHEIAMWELWRVPEGVQFPVIFPGFDVMVGMSRKIEQHPIGQAAAAIPRVARLNSSPRHSD
jgi:hypothetical protein